ncbi:hypothetical protein C4K07_5026 [Pseudomonas chlororaphis subsp. aureofaciens]|uniref:Uncharacterized protein n=1 Tax=Pseudomonas chlororaphis subsp. aureofaciens TaxID=587851 RepID=A0AAD1E837_9PSED|nr:hypothetical protein C4K07_5026 [Pseudomonas chlororaphis subsp. aureofaciens]
MNPLKAFGLIAACGSGYKSPQHRAPAHCRSEACSQWS